MKRKKFLSFVFCVNSVLYYCCGEVGGSPTQNLHNIAVNKFQSALQQQSFFSILTSIEERLRNLDNIYSMQLSQTLEGKLDLYNRRLEALDSKIIRLEALVMLNLDKISENISTKNFKDDVTKTNTFRKIDSIYEGISHRLSYMDRKYDTNFEKIQTKMDTTLTRLEKIEESMATRDSDIEAELSDAIFAIDDLKTTYNDMEGKLLNITTSTFNISKDSFNLLSDMNTDSKKSLNRFHDNIIDNLQYIDNKTSEHYITIKENNVMLQTMKTELKEDFNDYANKVADMNSYIWKNSDTTEDDLKMIATVVNSTRIEVQNGVRSLMLQIGKLSNKENTISVGSNNLESINKKLTTNFEKIISNQDVFLESCHRLQMDEAQIESEISVMLEKLIDMLEKKLASEVKDIKSVEKALKSHDWKVNRNVYQVNSNVISLFEKTTTHNEGIKKQIAKVSNDLDALFAFVQNVLTTGGASSTINIKSDASSSELFLTPFYISELPLYFDAVIIHLEYSRAILQSTSDNIKRQDINFKHLFLAFDGVSDFLMIMDKLNELENLANTLNNKNKSQLITSNTQENYFDQRISEQLENNSLILRSIESQIRKNLNTENIDIFDKIMPKYLNCTVQNATEMKSTDEIEIDDDTKKAIVEIFGTNPDLMEVNTKSPDTNKTNNCKQNYKSLINVRAGIDKKCQENEDNKRKKGKKRKKRPYQLDVRSQISGEDIEYEDSEETTESTTESEILIEEVDTSDIITESTTKVNEDIIYSISGVTTNDTIINEI